MSDENAKATTPHQDLIRSLLSPLSPKTEREHAAVREIERLERRISDEDRDRRERIATAALQGLLSCSNNSGSPRDYARDAVDQADALIAELDKPEEDKT